MLSLWNALSIVRNKAENSEVMDDLWPWVPEPADLGLVHHPFLGQPGDFRDWLQRRLSIQTQETLEQTLSAPEKKGPRSQRHRI